MFAKHVVAVGLGLLCVNAFSPTSFGQTAPEQEDETSARGAFFATRPGGNGANRPATNRKSTKPASTRQKNGVPTKPPGDKNATPPASITANAGPVLADSIGLGYTLYMRAADGDAVRVDPDREFGAGDQIRVALEANTDGYLYIFHTEDGRNPQMLFPDARLEGGANAVRAHVARQVPPALSDWFKFDARPAVERLYIIVTRTPLPDVPAGGALVKSCAKNPGACVWRPTPQVWARIKSHADAPAAVSKSVEFGQKESQFERDSLTRGIGLSREAPTPSVVRMNTSSNKDILVTTVELVHK